MKSCSDFRDNICAYIDNELSADERASFEKHLEVCPECKKETEEMSMIIGLCADIPLKELPSDFSSELHAKLVAVAQRQDDKIISINKSRKFKFTRTIASIAASMLIIFLAGTFYKYGINMPKGMKAEADYSSAQESEINAMADGAEQKSTEAAAGILAAGGAEKDDSAYAMDAMPEAPMTSPMPDGLDRSCTFDDSREKAALGRKQMAVAETASKKYSTITLLTDDPDSEVSKIRQVALSNNAEIMEDRSTAYESSDIKTFSLQVTSDEQKTELNIKLPYSQYDRFVEVLKETYGIAALQVGAFVTEDMTEILNTNISISNEIDNQIQELRKTNNEKNAETIKELQERKEGVDSLIEEIRLGSDEVFINIFINKK